MPKEANYFAKGNKAGSKANKLPPECKVAKEQAKAVIVQMCHRLTHEPKAEFKAWCARKDATPYEDLVGKAVANGNTKFLQWNFEMAIGKPTSLSDPEEKISNIEALVRSLAKKRDPFEPKAEK